MKIKDIESKLKSEQNSKNVPDVLARAKKAPINRLMDGQTPLKAFDKHTAVRLLWCAMLLLLTIVLAIGAVAMIPDGSNREVQLSYVSVKVETDGEKIEYGMVVENFQTIAAFVEEKRNGTQIFDNLEKKGLSVENALKDVYRAKNGDKVSICVLGRDIPSQFSSMLATAFSGDGIEVVVSENDSQILAELKAYTKEDSDDIKVLTAKYLSEFR